MRIEASNISTFNADPCLVVTHNDDRLEFNISYYGRSSLNSGQDLFEQLNLYWEQLLPTVQDSIYLCYKDMKNILDSPFVSHRELVVELETIANQLFNLHEFEDFKRWIFYKSNIKIPDIFEEVFIYNVDKQNSPDQTYLRNEYIDLVTLTLIFRTMMPVWGEFISLMKKNHGNFLKEFYAFELIKNTDIRQHRSFIKLDKYVDKTIGLDRYNKIAIIDEGLPSEDFQEWVLSRVIVRRLCVSDVRGNEPRANVVTFIHKYVEQSARPNQMSADNRIDDKNKDNRGGDGGDDIYDKLSLFEQYRIKHNVSMGELEEINFSLRNPYKNAYKLTSKMTDEIINTSFETIKQFYGNRITKAQILLMQWVLKPIISPKAIPYLDYSTVVQNLALVEAVLWARGHETLALFASSYPKITNGVMHISSLDSVKRLPADIVAELAVYYPFSKTTGGERTGYKEVNIVIDSIERLFSDLSMYVWIPTASEDKIQKITGTTVRKLPVPADIKILIAKLVLELGKRSWT